MRLLATLLLSVYALLAQSSLLLVGVGGPESSGGVSIPVTFVTGVSTVTTYGPAGTVVALGTSPTCAGATDTYCFQLPPPGLLANNSLYLACAYNSGGTTPSAKLGATSMTALTVSAAESTRRVADFIVTSGATGATQITFTTSAVAVYHCLAVEFAGISGLDGSVKNSAVGAASGTITAGSITPSTGDLVIMTGYRASAPTATSWTAGTGQTGITWKAEITELTDGLAVQWGTWSGAGAFTPQITTASALSTWIGTTAAFTASTTTGTLPTGMYISHAVETRRPATSTQTTGGATSYQLPSAGNLLVFAHSCGALQITAITDVGNAGKWLFPSPRTNQGTATSIAYAPNASVDSSGAMSVTYTIIPNASNGDCDGFFLDIVGAATVPNGNHMILQGDQASAGKLTYTSTYLPGVGAGLQIAVASNQGDTVNGISAPSGAGFMTATYAGQNQDGPTLPGENNFQGIGSFSSNAATTWTVTFSGSDAAGIWGFDVMSFLSSGASLGIFGNRFENTPTVTSGAMSVSAFSPRTSSGVIWVFMAWDGTTNTVSCADTINGTYNAVDSPVNFTIGGTAMRFQTFWVANTTTSSITPKCTISSGGTTGTSWMGMHEIIGVTTLDVHPAVKGGTATGTAGACNATGTLGTANEYIATGIVVASTEYDPGTVLTNQQNYNAGAKGDASGDLVVAATTSQTLSWTLDTSGDTYGCAVNSFR